MRLLRSECINFRTVNPGEKDMTLSERVKIVNGYCKKYGTKNCLLISIHSDAFTKKSAHGWSCFTSPGETKSDEFATMLYAAARKMWPSETLRKDNTDGDPDKEANFTVLTKTNCAAVLSENFFMTNEVECKKYLMNRRGRKQIAQVHVNAILNYINEG